MASVGLTGPEVAQAASRLCEQPLHYRDCPLLARAAVRLAGKSIRLCALHAHFAGEIDSAEVCWDDPDAEPLVVAIYQLHRLAGAR